MPVVLVAPEAQSFRFGSSANDDTDDDTDFDDKGGVGGGLVALVLGRSLASAEDSRPHRIRQHPRAPAAPRRANPASGRPLNRPKKKRTRTRTRTRSRRARLRNGRSWPPYEEREHQGVLSVPATPGARWRSAAPMLRETA